MDNKRYTKEHLVELWDRMDERGKYEMITAAEIIIDSMHKYPDCRNTAPAHTVKTET